MRSHPLPAAIAALALFATSALAQRPSSSYLSYADPDVVVASPGAESIAASLHLPILPADRLCTGVSSRAEAILADGTIVRVDVGTDVTFERLARTYESDDAETLITLGSGSLAVEARSTANEEREVRIDTEDATVVVPSHAFVRVDARLEGTTITVRAGYAELMARAGATTVGPGGAAFVKGEAAIALTTAALPPDAFTRFLEARAPREEGDSLEYLAESAPEGWDEEAGAYEASLLDDAGSWVWLPQDGRYGFRPRVVAGWRPYSSGFWRWTPGGPAWVASEPWGWLPSHFGTWIQDVSYGWCWIPDWDYSPGWVDWTYTATFVGCCPPDPSDGGEPGSGNGTPAGGRFEPGRRTNPRGPVQVVSGGPRDEVVRGEGADWRSEPRAETVFQVSTGRADQPLRTDSASDPRIGGSVDQGRVESPRFEAPQPDAPRMDGYQTVATRTEEPRTEQPRTEPTRVDDHRDEQQQADQQRFEQQRAEQQQAEQHRFEEERADQQRAEQQRFEQQRAESQRAEQQQREEQQRQEQQRADQQRDEQQRQEQQRADQQRDEQQRQEQQRADQQRDEQQRQEQQRSEQQHPDRRG